MIHTKASIRIACSATEAFDFVAVDFYRNYRRWSPEVLSLQALTTGPVRLGSLGRQVRIDMGVRTACRFRVSAFEPNRRIDFLCTTTPILSSYRMDELGQDCRLTFRFEYSGGSNLLLRPFRSQVNRLVKQGAERVVTNIRDLLESSVTQLDAG